MNKENKYSDLQYNNIVSDILNNKKFNQMDEIKHHGMTRKDHSLRVSYYSYKLSKLLGLDYIVCARAGLLHDFFLESNNGLDALTRIKTLINHPRYALENAKKTFDLTEKEQNTIVSHMFPVTLNPPKYMEGWIVNFVDDVVAIGEVCYSARTKLAYVLNFLIILTFTYFK